MHRLTRPTSFFTLAIMLLAAAPAWAQRGGHGGFGGMRGGFGGFSSGHMGGIHGGFGGFQGGFVGRGGIGLPQRSFIGIGGFNRGFNRFTFGDRRFFPGRSFFSPGFGFIGSFGYGYWPSYGYWPGYSYWPGYGYGADYLYSGYPYYAPSYGSVYQPPVAGSQEPATNLPAERYWLVALRDNTILLVSDYWLENSTLNYVTRDGKKSSVDLANVDLGLTKQLNQQRGLTFQLPRAQADYQPQRRDAYGHAY